MADTLNNDQLVGSKLKGYSSNPSTFITKGEEGNNPRQCNTSPTSIIVSDTKSFTKNNGQSSNTLNWTWANSIDSEKNGIMTWNWLHNHNKPGNISSNISIVPIGAGSSKTNRISINGGKVSLKVGGLKYIPSSDQRDNRYTDATISMNFPTNYDKNENGGKATLDINSFDNNFDGFIGQNYVNTPNPNVEYSISSKDNNIAYPRYNGGIASSFLIDNSNYSSTLSSLLDVYVQSNMPSSTAGTVNGHASSHTTRQTVNYNDTNTVDIVCDNDNKSFTFTDPDNSKSHTDDRQVDFNVKFLNETNNVGTTLSADSTSFTIYQSGGDVTLSKPTLTYSWTPTIDTDKFSQINGTNTNKLSVKWKTNPNTKGRCGGKLSWKVAPSDTQDNQGETQTLELKGISFVSPVQAIERSKEFACTITINDADLSKSSITNNPSKITIKQGGTSWSEPEMYVSLKVTPDKNNPSNVTDDSTRVPSCTINNKSSDTIRIWEENGSMRHDPIVLNFSNNLPVAAGKSNDGTVDVTSSGTTDSTAKAFATISLDGTNVSWNTSDIPAMAACVYNIEGTINRYGSDNENDTVTNELGTVKVSDGGNTIKKGSYNPVKYTITNSNQDYFSISKSSITLKNTSKKDSFTVSTLASNYSTLNSVTCSNIKYENSELTCDISADGEDSDDRSTTVKITKTSNDDTTLSQSSFTFTQNGVDYSGDITFTISKSGNGSYTENDNSISIRSNSGTIATDLVGDSGSISKGTLSVPNSPSNAPTYDAGKIDVSLNGEYSSTDGADTTLTVTGTLSKCSNSALNNTKVKWKDNKNTYTISPGTGESANYSWTFTPSTNVTSVTIDNSTSKTVTVNYPKNPNESSDSTGGTFIWNITEGDVFTSNITVGTKVGTVTGFTSGKIDSYTLGTLTCKFNDDDIPGTCTLVQKGVDAGDSETKRTLYAECTNAMCTFDKDDISATGAANSDYNTINSLAPGNIKTDITINGLGTDFTFVQVNKGKGISIGAFDDDATLDVGVKVIKNSTGQEVSNFGMSITCPCKVRLYTNAKDDGERTIYLQQSTSSKKGEYSISDGYGNYSIDSASWSVSNNNITPPSGARGTITAKHDVPQSTTITLNSVTIAGKTITLNYTWDVFVDGKHYYNA